METYPAALVSHQPISEKTQNAVELRRGDNGNEAGKESSNYLSGPKIESTKSLGNDSCFLLFTAFPCPCRQQGKYILYWTEADAAERRLDHWNDKDFMTVED